MIKRISIDFPQWCDHVISSTGEYAFADFETTGFDGDIVEASIVDPLGNILYDSLLRPACPISEGAMAVHHITEEMVSAAPCLNEEWPEISKRIKGRKLIAWNAKFDAGRLKHAMAAHNVPAQEFEWYCAMLEYTKFGNFQKWVKLQEACQYHKIAFSQEHRALGDVLAMVAVMHIMAGRKVWTKESILQPPDLQNWDDVRKVLEG